MLDVIELEKYIRQQNNEKINLLKNDAPSAVKTLKHDQPSFTDLLKNENLKLIGDDLKFSNHAITRLFSRNIELNGSDRQKIMEGINKLSEKGSKDALMLYKDLAMIVSVNNKTVVTVMDRSSYNGDGVFSGIDSAMLM